jgi:hypothetical protein
MPATPHRGDFVRVRTRRWLVEDERSAGDGLMALRLACVDDDAQGEVVEVLCDAELDGSILEDEGWAAVARLGTDHPSVFSAYLRALRWATPPSGSTSSRSRNSNPISIPQSLATQQSRIFPKKAGLIR